ncbi:penicillin acylase family protein [Vineibacter terrae]|uniref:penicillin acylase family protein n=1 Tax=Vineibacter terrae TaxID=2586908 RepID=UPI002E31772E|nr:penicillin acylase family protein [Vineibacter terrae]HEX2891027.1 penicillin acylase family protein [Vineibacter terrae]
MTANAAAGMAGADIWRDAWGIPHIKARGQAEAFAALGFAHAQDRLWQMEALLRRGIGRYAEWTGKAAVNADILARRLDTAGASQRDFAALGAEARAMLEAYASGVNAFIATGYRPVEHRLLGAEPMAWQPWHSIAVMRQIGFLMGSVWWKLWRAAALPIVGAEAITRLRYEDGGNELLCLPPGLETGPYKAAMADLRPGIEALLETAAIDVSGGGSNNWALAPERTATGRPLLAGDPHRALEMPNMYAQAHLACDDFDVIGLTVPGVPGFPHFGHNGAVAWCVTHAFVDIHDLYVERFSDDARTCLFKGQWEPVRHRRERIAVRGEADIEADVVETRHGPVIAGDPRTGTALALRSMQFAETDRSFDCMIPMLRAGTVATLYEATREWGLIDHNLVAGDTGGRIGYRVRAKVPRRPRSNGWLPVPGWTGEHEWDGIVDWHRMPAAIDPAGGIVVTANNRVAAEGEDYLCTEAMPPHRARRIWQRLATLASAAASVEAMADIHRDVQTIPGGELRERLRAVSVEEPQAAALRRCILDWDGRMAADSIGASAYVAVRLALTRLVADRSGLRAVAQSPYAQVPPGTVAENQLWWAVPGLLRADDRTLLGGASWEELLRLALAQAATETLQPWGTTHQPRFTHPLSATFPDHAAALDRASAPVGGDNDTIFATGCIAAIGTRAVYASLSRYVFDVGAWENCRWVVFHGASGEPDSPWHMNQNAAWAKGEMVPMLYDWAAVTAGATQHRHLSFRNGHVYVSQS